MAERNAGYRLVLAAPKAAEKLTEALAKRPQPPRGLAAPTIDPSVILKAAKATVGFKDIIGQVPQTADIAAWTHVATFCVCVKLGTARYLDIWDADHFDYYTDMARNLSQCRAWFSADGYGGWGSAGTRTGRINCYFDAPVAGTYVCNAELQSDGASAQVECLIDSFNYGPLAVSGHINQPHFAALTAGGHHFRIRQLQGAFFFISLTVWRV
jgi:hypothetical protein